MSKQRSYFVTKSQHFMLNNWGEQLAELFNGNCAYHVGSSLERRDWFDIDVRILLEPQQYRHLKETMNLDVLDAIVSQWGATVTGLPIDFQIQDRDEANNEYSGTRNAMML